jgi:hypothetical protein
VAPCQKQSLGIVATTTYAKSPLPSAVWHAIALSKFDIPEKLLNTALMLTNKSLRGRFAVLPVVAYYYAIFRSQSKFAGILEHAARR